MRNRSRFSRRAGVAGAPTSRNLGRALRPSQGRAAVSLHISRRSGASRSVSRHTRPARLIDETPLSWTNRTCFDAVFSVATASAFRRKNRACPLLDRCSRDSGAVLVSSHSITMRERLPRAATLRDAGSSSAELTVFDANEAALLPAARHPFAVADATFRLGGADLIRLGAAAPPCLVCHKACPVILPIMFCGSTTWMICPVLHALVRTSIGA